MKAFTAALGSLGKDQFTIGKIPPIPGLVDEYFNDSTGVGDEGGTDANGPWNSGGDRTIVELPELEQGVENLDGAGGKKPGRQDSQPQRVKKSA